MGRGANRWAMCACAALVLALPATASAAANDPMPAQAIAELNQWRAELGESAVSTTDVAAWDQGCADHNTYEQDQTPPTLTHFETPGNPGYTADGSVAGPDSVLAEEQTGPDPTPTSELLPGPVWDSAVFHRAAVLQPRLANIGFNSTTFAGASSVFTSWVCMWIQNMPGDPAGYTPPTAIDNARTTPSLTLYPSPANGALDVPTTFPAGTESPDPAQETGVPNGATLGWLLNVEINGPWGNAGGGGIVWAHGVTATLEPDGTNNTVPIVVSECGATGCAHAGGTAEGPYLSGGFGIFPTQALAANTTYHASASGTVTDNSNPASPVDHSFSMHWCFSTGPTYATSVDCSASTTNAGVEPAVQSANLTVSVSGSGSVSDSGAISCPQTSCTSAYPPGTIVTLTEMPSAGQQFTGWSGACTGSATTCHVTMDADKSATATFAPITHTLTVAKAGTGSGTIASADNHISCGATCSHSYNDGSSITLTATPANGSTFDGWSGSGCAGTAPCTVSMTSDRTVTATFTSNPPPPPGSPTIAGTALSGLAHRKPKLGFVLAAGANAPPLKQIVVSPPARLGLKLSTKPGSLVKGVHIKGPAGAPLGFTAAVQHGVLVISLQSPATQLTVSIVTPAITESKALQRRVKRRSIKQLTFVVTATDAAGTATPFSLKLTP